jgi:hypothetical protein
MTLLYSAPLPAPPASHPLAGPCGAGARPSPALPRPHGAHVILVLLIIRGTQGGVHLRVTGHTAAGRGKVVLCERVPVQGTKQHRCCL